MGGRAGILAWEYLHQILHFGILGFAASRCLSFGLLISGASTSGFLFVYTWVMIQKWVRFRVQGSHV